jgi:uncharacterized protein YjbI with pentapeptide repeats
MVDPFAWDWGEMFCPGASSFWPSTGFVRYSFVDKKINSVLGVLNDMNDDYGKQNLGDVAPSSLQSHGSGHHPVSAARLKAVIERHESWVGSGWETGQKADLHRADLHRANLRGALLLDADLHRADLHGADLEDADLDGADLHEADLHRADLHGAELRWADLHDADLHNADLSGAILCDADLHRADLHGADLNDADLTDTDLRGANLSGVKGLTGAQITGASCDPATRLPANLKGSVARSDEG